MSSAYASLGSWTRTNRESITLEPTPVFVDDFPTEVTEVTEIAPSPLEADLLPTVQIDRSKIFDDTPTRPDVRRVLTVLRRRAGLPPASPNQAGNRVGATPAPPPRRVLYSTPRPLHSYSPAPSRFEPAEISSVTEVTQRFIESTLAEEYGWWLAGVAVGSVVGTLACTAAFA